MSLLGRLDALHGFVADGVRSGAALGWLEPPSRHEVAALLGDLDDRVSVGRAGVRLALDGDEVTGFGYWRSVSRPSLAGVADLEKLLVAPGRRGRGIGTALLAGLLEDARAAGVEVLTLDVRGDNRGAVTLYERHGFAVVGVLPGAVLPATGSDRRLDRVTMALRLDDAPLDPHARAEHLCGWVLLRRLDGHVLLARRSGVAYGAGLWGPPGGHARPGERLVDAAARELHEEVGVRVDPAALTFVGVQRYEEPDPGGDTGFDAFYAADAWAGEPAPVSECSEVAWCDPSRLPSDSLPWLAATLRTHLLAGVPFADLP